MSTTGASVCPECGTATVSVTGGIPWCPACEWNLGAWDPSASNPHGFLWLERRTHRHAYRFDQALVSRYRGRPPVRPEWTGGRIGLVAVAVVLLLAALGCLVAGVLLLVLGDTFLRGLLGIVLILLALVVRPRLGRAPRRRRRLDPAQAPDLVALVGAVATAVGTRAPDHIVVDSSYNMAVAAHGLRRRRTLYLGTALWVTFDPAMRTSVLAHEFGHFVGGDPNRNLLVQPVLRTFGRLADWTGADQTLHDVAAARRRTGLSRLALYAVSRIFLVIHLALTALGFRDRQHAEVRADAVSVRVAGRDASDRAFRRLAISGQVRRIIGYAAETHPPRDWRRLIETWEREHPQEVGFSVQLSMRGTSLWSTHPPHGARLALVRSWPDASEPLLHVDRVPWDRIDASLAPYYRKLHERMLGRREYRPAR